MSLFSQTLHRRLFIFLGLMMVSGILMLTRLTHLQVVAGDQYVELVDANRFYTMVLPKERGMISDRYGNPLVFNQPLYYKQKYPDRLYGEKVLIERAEALQLMTDPEQEITLDAVRWYPLGAAGSQIVGYAGPVTAEDVEADRTLRSTDTVGKTGLEKRLNENLQGENATSVYEINALGKKTRLARSNPGRPGETVETTIDPFLTAVAHTILGEQTGSLVVSDAETGAVIALASAPSFDPNILSTKEANPDREKERRSKVSELFNHPKQLFFNRAIGGAYPPGSVFKLVTAVAGLETKAVDANTLVQDEGVLKVGEFSYGNWYYSQYGRTEGAISLQRALARSNDIYFYKAAEFIGPEKLSEYAKLFGFGKKTEIELSGETAGFVPSPSWKEEKQGEKWYLGNTYHFGIGQGDLLVSPLQVNQMTQTVANRGTICQPAVLSKDQRQCKGLSFLEENLQIVVSGMLDACSVGGTAFPFFPWNSEYRNLEVDGYTAIDQGAIACKTGTAEFGITTADNRKKTHGWFTMIITTRQLIDAQLQTLPESQDDAVLHIDSFEKYLNHMTWLQQIKKNGFPEKLVITVMVESDEILPYKEGSKDAAPLAKKLLDWMSGIPLEKVEEVVKAVDVPAGD